MCCVVAGRIQFCRSYVHVLCCCGKDSVLQIIEHKKLQAPCSREKNQFFKVALGCKAFVPALLYHPPSSFKFCRLNCTRRFAFSGPLPEKANGRLSMLGFVAALGAELATGEPVFTQVSCNAM